MAGLKGKSGPPRNMNAFKHGLVAIQKRHDEALRWLSFKIGRDPMHMLDCLSANGLEERSVPRVLLQPRTERTSARPR
jgi:hypothetical protein